MHCMQSRWFRMIYTGLGDNGTVQSTTVVTQATNVGSEKHGYFW